ncbi:uncharacterized protein V6R79_002629 [Siganus canaliculatus]
MEATLTLLFILTLTMERSSSQQNFCSNSTVLRTRMACHSCSISTLMPCPSGFRQTPGSTARDCKYFLRTPSLQLAISGCSMECHREVEVTRCCPGFWGPDCIECPDQASRPCSGRGLCSEGLGGNGTCSCQEGFAGTACEDCAPGRYGSTCSSACSCVHGLCDSGLKGTGSCICFSGYSGTSCDRELPECAALGCQQNSRCVEEALTGRLVCQCLPGHRRSGDQCLSIDPCLQRPCHAQASCVHTGPNQHLCTCDDGYSGDGRVCVAIDPCQSQNGGCAAESARCIRDGPGKSHCECLPGFHLLLDGSCSLVDACRPDSCHRNANCSTVAPGQVQCTCLQGYVGNGKVCYGNIVQRLTDLNTDPRGPWSGQLSNAISLFGSVSWPLQNLGPFTVFIPINKGFKGTPVRTLMADQSKAKYLCKMHLVAGVMPFSTLKSTDVFYTLTGKSAETDTSEGDTQTKIRIHGSRKKGVILQSDLVASNGIIHIINKLMDSVSPTVESDAKENLMKIVSDYGKFDRFKSLLENADLTQVLDLPGPVTVFAPTSSAFEAMTEGHLQHLSSSQGRHKLVELLRNHIVPSTTLEVFAAVSAPRIVTMANQVLTINVTETGQMLVNGAAVLEAAVEAKNGRLYVLDGVLTPPSIEPVLPHRCDVNETKVIKGECVSCSKVQLTRCSSGVYTGSFTFGCLYSKPIGGTTFNLLVTGCSPLCNATVTTPACCSGFYGPDCSPCPGGYHTPCSGHGQCQEGLGGNGSCICHTNFGGSRCQYCSSSNKYGPNCDKTCPCIHGQCDNRPDSDGRCKLDSCQMGFTGRFCERRTAPCGAQVRFCHAHADCDFSQGTARCVCKPGYQGDGITCVESDPCALPLRGGCSVNAKCVRTGPGAHTCQCLSGWREDGDDCQPINNCNSPTRGGCHANATCIYVGPGQSDCSCKSGYRGNGLDCEAVNQCVSANRGCHFLASCRLLSSQWTCVCDDGYVGDGHQCYGSVRQELMSLPDISEFSAWTTESGLSWTLSDQNLTLLAPSSAAVANMSPEDRSFWTTRGNLPSLIRNHVVPGYHPVSSLSNTTTLTSLLKTTLPVSTTNEVTTVGGAAVTTANVAATNGLIHIIDKVLVPDRKLSEGLLATLALRPEFSLFRSLLMDYNLTDEIERADEFTVFAPTDAAINEHLKKMAATALDVNTTRYHVVPSRRLLKTDLQLGGFKPTLLGFSFQLSIFLRNGKLLVNDARINSSNILSGNGVIHGLSDVLTINRNRCDEITYQKVMGNCVDCLNPQQKVCPNDTTPDASVKKKKCMFSRTFEDERLLTIGCRASCQRQNVIPRCCPGFFGQHCEPCPGPRGQACFANGLCVDGINGTGLCQCNRGFEGTACETCQSGKYGVHCDQDCRCKHGRCSDGVGGDGTCECDVGWRGVLCEENIESRADELCGSVKCHTSANCVIGSSGSQCVCAVGFQGNGTFCQAKDPCLEAHGGCSPDAVCKRTVPGKRECVCGSGYYGDGLVCVEINPCSTGNGGCHSNAVCVHTGPNKSSCSCNDGYSGDGQTCSIINLCQKKNGGCHDFAVCDMKGPGVRTCTCNRNFVGDGVTCRGTVGKEILRKRLRDFYLGLMMVDVSLKGRGPFTVFAPNAQAFASDRNGAGKLKSLTSTKHIEQFAAVMRNHIVMCHILQSDDLRRPRNLTSLSGHVLTARSSQGSVSINEANVTSSSEVAVNGIFHEIDQILFPPNSDLKPEPDASMNLTDVADRHGYKTFFKLLQDSGVLELINDDGNRPLTVFLPSDAAMASLPQKQKDFLYHPDNRAKLLEYLKYHVLPNQKVYAEGLIHLDSARTLQGSPVSFSCGGSDAIGEIFVSGRRCRVVQRHLVFTGGIAYGLGCLLTPPSLGGRCDKETSFHVEMSCGLCTSSVTRCPKGFKLKEVQKCDLPTMFVTKYSGCRSVCTVNVWQPTCCPGYYGRDCLVCPGGARSPCGNHGKCDDGHLGNGTCACDAGFMGVACELCRPGFYGPTCAACECTENGFCDSGRKRSGACVCQRGWRGRRCELRSGETRPCVPECSTTGVCRDNNTCECLPGYYGDGYSCSAEDLCAAANGGCAKEARCAQSGQEVTCVCGAAFSGDGVTCLPIDPCSSGDNGGCHEHATCTLTAPGARTCTCKSGYDGDGFTCELKRPISRCLQDNGRCHRDATCTDLHFEDAMLGVFHLRADRGQYRLNYTEAERSCRSEGGSLATFRQLSRAQQGGMNVCSAGWLDGGQVAYPTTFPNQKCGFGHVGIVDYGVRKNRSETWDAFCYRMKEVECACGPGFVGDGLSCSGTLLQVLQSNASFSNFLTQILNASQASDSGRRFLERLSDPALQSTLFVPDNDGLPENQTLSQRDLEFHLSEGQALPVSQLRSGSRIRTRAGSLTVLGVPDLLDPSALASRYINDRFITDADVIASNGIIHVLQGPLKAPPPRPQMHVAHKAGMGVGVVLLVLLAAAAVFVGHQFYAHNMKPFRFHYFKDDDGQEEAPPTASGLSNPVYETPSGSTRPEARDLDPDQDRGSDLHLQDG